MYKKYYNPRFNNKKIKKKTNEKCCEKPNLVYRDGSLVCTQCGEVKGREFKNTEKPAYSFEQLSANKRTERTGRIIGARTIIPKGKRDCRGNHLSKKEQSHYRRLSKIQNSLIDSTERNFWEARPKLKKLAQKLNLPEYINETAWRIYKECGRNKLCMGRSIISFVAASIYASVRIHEVPKILDEVCHAALVPRQTVHHVLSIVVKDVLPDLNLKYKPITPRQLVFKFGIDLNLPIFIQHEAAKILNLAFKRGLKRLGKDPRGFAASVIYIVTKFPEHKKHRKTQAEIAEIAQITEVTLRSRVKEIKKLI